MEKWLFTGYFHGISTTRTKVVSDFDKTFRICRAFSSEYFDKKNFSESFCFDQDKLKILWALKTEKLEKLFFFRKIW